MLFRSGGGYQLENATPDVGFANGTYLTYFAFTSSAATAFNNLEFDYGVLPLPKYDEAQENYTSLGWSHIMMIPNTADADFTGLVTEWMSYYGNKLIRPKFYDSLMSVRFAQDEETVDMLDIIFNNRVYDLGDTVWGDKLRDGVFKEMFTNNDRAISSKFESMRTVMEKTISDAVKGFSGAGN